MNRGLLWTWRRQARKQTAVGGQTFVPVRVVEEPAAPSTPAVPVRQTKAATVKAPRSGGARTAAALGTIDIEVGGARVRKETLSVDPFAGGVFVFRAKRADRLKILVWDGSGLVLLSKRLERGRFTSYGLCQGI